MMDVFMEATPGHEGKYWYRYDVYLEDGTKIVSNSIDPEHDMARVLGSVGLVEPRNDLVRVIDRKTGKHRSTVRRRTAERHYVVEDGKRGLRRQKWKPRPNLLSESKNGTPEA